MGEERASQWSKGWCRGLGGLGEHVLLSAPNGTAGALPPVPRAQTGLAVGQTTRYGGLLPPFVTTTHCARCTGADPASSHGTARVASPHRPARAEMMTTFTGSPS